MDIALVFQKLAVALALGLLVGLQRERVRSPLAGIRTFALITILGTVAGLLDIWVVVAGLVGLAALLFVGNMARISQEEADPGLTTEIAALVMYGIGAYLGRDGETAVAVVLAGCVALLLHLKAPMHAFVAKIGEKDVTAIMQFVLIALVVLPVLPNEGYGPYGALNPHKTWLMVVLIVGISLAGYVVYKLFGQEAGAVLGGVLGGLVSSTATTMSAARRARENEARVPVTALVIMIASTVAYGRVLVEIGVVAPAAFPILALPLGIMLAWMIAISGGMYLAVQREQNELPPPENPAELLPALIFGGLYAVVVLAIAAAQDYFGNAGLYAVAFLSGLHDMDAITLSTAGYVEQELAAPGTGVAADTGWRLILLASLSNFLFKGGLALALGGLRLLRWLAVPFLAAFAGGGALLTWG
jgi:uncharacterized membrane protein (DUF4010 family)